MLFVSGITLANSQSQLDSTWAGRTIGKIEVAGNYKTRSSFILRELKQKSGDNLDLELMEEGRKRIQNLELFHRVMLVGQPRSETIDLIVLVTEQWYLFPYPLLHINERDWKKISYGAGIMHTNVRGLGERLSFYFNLGYNPSVKLSYLSPWLFGPQNLFGGINLFYQKVKSKHYLEKDVFENYSGGNVVMGKRFGYHFESELKIGYQSISMKSESHDVIDIFDGTDGMPFIGLNMTWDFRDLKEYPHHGWYLNLSGRKMGIPQHRLDYWRSNVDLRCYLPIKESTLALRVSNVLSKGQIPVYDQVYLGYNERIRGHFFNTFEGEQRALATIAYRFPLIPIQYYDAGEEPHMQDWPLGLSMGFFGDTGLVWNQDQDVTGSMFISGYGVGLHFHLPFVQVLRLELAFNETGRSQYILDMMVYF